MIPLVEVAVQIPVEGPQAGQSTGTVNPGVIWFGRYLQLGLELQIPINRESGMNVGVLAQLHFYLDDIAPRATPPTGARSSFASGASPATGSAARSSRPPRASAPI